MKYLIKEYYELCEGGLCQDFLTEQEKKEVKNGTIYLTGVIQRADTKNGNGRIYPKNTLERELNNYMKLVKEARAVGELDHYDQPTVNLKNVSHLITEIWWNGNDVMGKMKVLSTPCGKILESLIRDGVRIGISSRGLGSVKEEQDVILVEDDFQIICFDIVQEPSTSGAFLMQESKNLNKQIFSKKDRINRIFNKILTT